MNSDDVSLLRKQLKTLLIQQAIRGQVSRFILRDDSIQLCLTLNDVKTELVSKWEPVLRQVTAQDVIFFEDTLDQGEGCFGAKPKEGFLESLLSTRRLQPRLLAIRHAKKIEYLDYGETGSWDTRMVDLVPISQDEYSDFVSRYPDYEDPLWVDSEGQYSDPFDKFPAERKKILSVESEPTHPFLAVWKAPIIGKTGFSRVMLHFEDTSSVETTLQLLRDFFTETVNSYPSPQSNEDVCEECCCCCECSE